MSEIGNQQPPIGNAGRPLVLGLLAIAVVFGLAGRARWLVDIPRHQDGVYGVVARNCLKYGYVDFGLSQISSPGPKLGRPERVCYQNHPPLVPLLSSFSLALFGPRAWALRLPHLLAGAAAVVVLARLAARVSGGMAWAWVVAVGAAVPMAVRYAGPFVDPIGPFVVLWCSLAVLLYMRYCESGSPRDFWLLFAVCFLALLTDWPGYPLGFALAGHALIYRSKARRAWMLLLPVVTLACLGFFMWYASLVPPERNLFQPMGASFKAWARGGAGEVTERFSLGPFVADFATKYVIQFTPLALLVLVWLVRHARRAVWTRENRPDQHVLLLWAVPLPYLVAFPMGFPYHDYQQVVFLPAVVVTTGLAAAELYRWGKGRPGVVRGTLAVAGMLALLLSSFYAMTERDRLEPLRHRQVRWAKDLAAHAPFEGESAFVLHYAQQMRFVADRRVIEYVDTPAKVAELSRATRVFAPLAHPCGDAGLFGELRRKGPATLCGSLVAFGPDPDGGGSWADGIRRRLEKQELSAGVSLEKLVYTVVPARDGSPLLSLGPTVSGLPKTRPEDRLEWQVRFLGDGGKALGTVSMPAQASASYFVLAPKGWREQGGRAELALRLCTTDAASVGRGTRLMRLAFRFLTLRTVGNPKPIVRPLGQVKLAVR